MKKALVFALAAMFAGSVLAAEVGQDDASNYSSGWDDVSTYGTGFSTWSFTQTAGYWAPSYSTMTGFGDISTSDLVLALNYGTGYVNANRDITTWGADYTFTIDLATQWRNGGRGIDLLDASSSTLWNFNVSDLGYGDTAWAYQSDMVLSFSVTQNGTDLDISVTGSSASSAWSDVYNTSVAGTLAGFSLYAGDTGADNSAALLANNMTVNSAAVPEPATMSLLGLGALAMVLRRKIRK